MFLHIRLQVLLIFYILLCAHSVSPKGSSKSKSKTTQNPFFGGSGKYTTGKPLFGTWGTQTTGKPLFGTWGTQTTGKPLFGTWGTQTTGKPLFGTWGTQTTGKPIFGTWGTQTTGKPIFGTWGTQTTGKPWFGDNSTGNPVFPGMDGRSFSNDSNPFAGMGGNNTWKSPSDRDATKKAFLTPAEKSNAALNNTVHFFLFNLNGETRDEQLVQMETDGSVPEDLWNPSGAIKLIIHGYHADYTLTPFQHLEDHRMPLIAEEYAKVNDTLNVIIVEWSNMAIRLTYPVSADNTRFCGAAVAGFLVALKEKSQFESWEDVHIIGFSLGSHAAGVAGFHIQQVTNGEVSVGRITGLDPAGPMFDTDEGTMPDDLSGFLEKSDANFVDIIHCNMGFLHWTAALPEGRLGSNIQTGHADFYPNGGVTQLQCTPESDKTGCSHRCCVFFYAYSLTKPTLACPCNSMDDLKNGLCACNETTGEYMGDPCRPTASGKYFLRIDDAVNVTTIAKTIEQLFKTDPAEAIKHFEERRKIGSDANMNVTFSEESRNASIGGQKNDLGGGTATFGNGTKLDFHKPPKKIKTPGKGGKRKKGGKRPGDKKEEDGDSVETNSSREGGEPDPSEAPNSGENMDTSETSERDDKGGSDKETDSGDNPTTEKSTESIETTTSGKDKRKAKSKDKKSPSMKKMDGKKMKGLSSSKSG